MPSCFVEPSRFLLQFGDPGELAMPAIIHCSRRHGGAPSQTCLSLSFTFSHSCVRVQLSLLYFAAQQRTGCCLRCTLYSGFSYFVRETREVSQLLLLKRAAGRWLNKSLCLKQPAIERMIRRLEARLFILVNGAVYSFQQVQTWVHRCREIVWSCLNYPPPFVR